MLPSNNVQSIPHRAEVQASVFCAPIYTSTGRALCELGLKVTWLLRQQSKDKWCVVVVWVKRCARQLWGLSAPFSFWCFNVMVNGWSVFEVVMWRVNSALDGVVAGVLLSSAWGKTKYQVLPCSQATEFRPKKRYYNRDLNRIFLKYKVFFL